MSVATEALPIRLAQVPSARRAIQTAGYFAAFIALGLSTGSLGPTLPALASNTRVSIAVVSYLFTARSLGYTLGAMKGGRLFDRQPGNPIIASMLALMALRMVLTPLLSAFSVLTVAMFLLGIGEAMLDVGANTLLVRVHRHRSASVMNALHACFGFGALAAPMIVAVVMALNQAAGKAYFVLALILAPMALCLWRIPSPTTLSEAPAPQTTTAGKLLIFLLAAFLFLYVGAEVGFGGWIFTYAVALKLSTPLRAAYLTSIFWATLTAGRLVAVTFARRFQPRTILLGSLIGSLLSVWFMIVGSQSFAWTLLGTVGLGFSMAAIFPMLLALAATKLTLTGAVTGRFVLGASLGAMTAPWLIGQLFERIGPVMMLYMVFGSLILAAGIWLWVLGLTSESPFPSKANSR